MILPMWSAAPPVVAGWWLGQWSVVGRVGGRVGRRRGRGDGDERRPDDAVAEPVAAPDLARRSRPRARPVPGTLAIASCSRGIERRARARPRSGVTPSLSSSARSLRSIAAMPSTQRSSASSAGRVVDRAVEVVGDGEHLADAGPRRRARASRSRSSVGPAPVVAELGALALEAGEVLVGLRAGRRRSSAVQLLDVGERASSARCRSRRSAPRPGSVGHAVAGVASWPCGRPRRSRGQA